MSKKNSQSFPRCTLCKGVINILGNSYVVGATGRMVCRSCLETSFHILEEVVGPEEEAASAPAQSVTPQHIIRELDKSIIGQEQAKSAVALAAWKQMLRANGDNAVPRTNLLLYGPSGCGKTAIIREAAKIAELPFLTVDATGITETGYRGKNAADIVTDLLAGFKGHPHVRHAIIFVDEVDKLSVKADYIADRLLFALAVGSMHYHTSADLQAARPWLSGCVGYLFQREEPPQRSFYYLIKLTELPQDARMAFFDGYLPPSHPLRRDADMPKLFRELEVICVMAISGVKKLPM